MVLCRGLAVLALAGAAADAAAQTATFHYPAPPASSFTVSRDVPYADGLQMDVYRPAGSTAPAPVVLFLNAATGPARQAGPNPRWAELAAARGLTAVVPDIRLHRYPQDLESIVAHMAAEAARYGGDADALAVFAASGNVFRVLPFVQNPAETRIKAAVMLYGNYAGGRHAFELLDAGAATADAIERTLDFLTRAPRAAYLGAVRANVAAAGAAAAVLGGRWDEAVRGYAALVAARPADAALGLSYGEALLGAGRFADACAQFETLRNRQLGPRDLAVPAAKACLQKGDPDAAIGWLKSIPPRFLPPALRDDPVFAPLRGRADFQALWGR
jgi:hypothetical protein